MRHGSTAWNTTSGAGQLWGGGTLLWDSETDAATPDRRWSQDATAVQTPETLDEPEAPLSRGQIVARILDLNSSATLAYLGQFDDEALKNYLDHLETAQRPRGPRSRWVRRGDSRAIVGRESEH